MKTRASMLILTCVFFTIPLTGAGQPPASQPATSQPQQLDLINRLLALPSPPPDWKEQARLRNAALPNSQRDWFEGEPPEEAAADVLLAHWREHCWDKEIRPTDLSDKLRQRILEATEEQPYDLMMVLRLLPDTPDAAARVERMYKAAQQSGKPDNPEWFKRVLDWLGEHNENYRGDLITLARSARDRESWIENREVLRALAKVDWEAARPVLLAHADGRQTGVAGLSLSLLYRHAVASGSHDEAASLRERSKSLVANQAARDEGRSLACEALMASEWEGRDEWFLSLFVDPSLSKLDCPYFLCIRPIPQPPALLAVVRNSPAYWIPRVATLLGNRNRSVHNAAVHCLAQFQLEDARADALRPLLPWLFDPNWADDGPDLGRLRMIQSLDRVKLPESVPGLIQVAERNTGFKLAGAAEALAFYKAKDAIPILKAALAREPDEHQRRAVIRALVTLRGFSTDELLDAVEAYAAASANGKGKNHIEKALDGFDDKAQLEVKISIGYWSHCYRDNLGDDAVQKLVNRTNELSKEHAALAHSLWSVISTWDAKPVDAEILRRLATGTIDENSIFFALQRRESLRKHVPDQLAALCKRSGTASGVALVLLGDAKQYPAALQGSDAEAQSALLACARLIREPLPVPMVAELLKSKDERLSKAAWMYIEREDSPAARKIVMARYPGQVKIIGCCSEYEDSESHENPCAFAGEDELRKAILAPDGPDEIIALLSFTQFVDDIQRIINVRGNKAELRITRNYCDDAPQTLLLSEKQWLRFKSFLSENAVDDLAPFDAGANDGVQYEYVHLTRDGGRRVYMNNPDAERCALYDRLVRRFEDLADAAECRQKQ